MSGRKNVLVTFGFAAAVSLIVSAVSVLLFTYHYSRQQFGLVNLICGKIAEQEPEALKIISATLKEFKDGNAVGSGGRNEGGSAEGSAGRNVKGSIERNNDVIAEGNTERNTEGNTGGMGGKDILGSLGYGAFDLSKGAFVWGLLYTGSGLLTGVALLCATFLYRNRKEAWRIQALADYL